MFKWIAYSLNTLSKINIAIVFLVLFEQRLSSNYTSFFVHFICFAYFVYALLWPVGWRLYGILID